MKNLNYEKVLSNIRKSFKDFVIKAGVKSVVIGVSGGIDSAIVCAIVKPIADELSIELIGRFISIESNKPDERERAIKIGESFCSDFKEIDLTDEFNLMKDIQEDCEDVGEITYKIRLGNIKARMRMIYLYNLAAKNSGIVLGTENLTEHYLGFCTLHGDSASDFEPILGLWKNEVYSLADYLVNLLDNVDHNAAVALNHCILCNATDGLGISNTDLDQILPDWKNRHSNTRSGYKEVDEIFTTYFEVIEKLNTSLNYRDKIDCISIIDALKTSPVIQRYLKTDFKRNHPVIVKRENIL
jgi:NAD+ synthetase